MQEDLYNWYKEGAESLPNMEPPPMVWENVTAVLDNKGAKKKRFGFWWWTAGAFVIVLLSSLFLRQQFTERVHSNGALAQANQNPNNNESTYSLTATSPLDDAGINEKVSAVVAPGLSENATNITRKEENAVASSTLKHQAIATPYVSAFAANANNPTQTSSANPTTSNGSETFLGLPTATQTTESSENLHSINAPDLSATTTNQTITTALTELPLSIVPKDKSIGSLWYFGIASEFNNNYLFNHDLIDALRKESNNSLLPHFSTTWAFMGAKSFAPGKAIRVEMLISKTEGQHYMTYSEGILQKKTIHLNYSGASILYDKTSNKSMRLMGMPVRTHWQIGPQLCVLGGSTLAVGENNYNPAEYRKLNLSLIGGLEEELFLSNQFSVAGGIRLNAGMTNIFKGVDNIPAYFNRTHTGNLALTLNLRYYLRMPK